jgi:hypothetical protein
VDALEETSMTPLLIELDGVLGDTRPLWDDWVADSSRLLDLGPDALPHDRGAAAAALDEPVYLRPDAAVSAALRSLASTGTRLGVFTDAPEELAHVAVAQLGATRRIEAIECGSGARDRLRTRLGAAAEVVETKAGLLERAPVDSRSSQ